MNVATRILGGTAVKRISAAGILAFVALVFLLRFLILEGPSLPLASIFSNQTSAPVVELLRAQYGAGDEQITQQHSLAPTPAAGEVGIIETLLGKARDVSIVQSKMLSVWNYLKPVMVRADLFPEAKTRVKDASAAWEELVKSVVVELDRARQNTSNPAERQCPYSVSSLNATDLNRGGGLLLNIPCGLVLDSSITLVGVPRGPMGEFRIDLVGQKVPGETRAPIIFHHNIRLGGDKLSPGPVIVQNTWTAATDWGDEKRCPPSQPGNNDKRVDGLLACAAQVGKDVANASAAGGIKWPGELANRAKQKPWFPYAEAHPFAATLWVGWDGFHMTVDGKHITSFEYRQNLEPWMVSGVSIDGSLQLSSVIANGLPTSESLDTLPDLETLKAPKLQDKLDMFIGVFSTGNNFERRMAVRRSWMQYDAVRSGKIAVRFFVGLHQNQQVNKEVWKEGVSYGDIQLLPFIDYYNLITLKTLAICIFATKVVEAEYVMKTDDDTFVRVDEVLSAVKQANHAEGLLYGLIEVGSKPDRDSRSKWYITTEEWPLPQYPPWAHGPGYVVSKDIAKFVVRMNQEMRLKLFKLEDVAMGAWIEEYQMQGKNVSYVKDFKFFSDGCSPGYMIAHYQNPRQMVCLWQQLLQGSGPVCC